MKPTYCESCPIFKACKEKDKSIQWCEEKEKQYPDWEDDSHPGFLKKSEYTSKTEEIHSNIKKEGE